MKIKAIKTEKIVPGKNSLLSILDKYVSKLGEESILVITSKIISICEGRVIKMGTVDKQELIKKEAQYLIPPEKSKYNISLTIARGHLVPTAGIDESNGNGFYVLWPEDSQKTANTVREYFAKKFKLKKFGVVITDSRTSPLRWGTSGWAMAHSGFTALNDYIEKPDIFGRPLKVTKASIVDGLAMAAVLVMGEGDEQTPLAVVEDVPFVSFQKRNPTKKEIEDLKINLDDDLYAPLLKNAPWVKGKATQ